MGKESLHNPKKITSKGWNELSFRKRSTAAIAVTEAARYDGQTNRGSRSAGQKKELEGLFLPLLVI